MRAKFDTQNVRDETRNVTDAFMNVHAAMAAADYEDSEYRIIAQTYPSVIPNGSAIRYPESNPFSIPVPYSRQAIGGCGVLDRDADWINSRVVPTFNNTIRTAATDAGAAGVTNIDVLDMSQALDGHRLCERSSGLLEEKRKLSWQSPGASDSSEWVQQARIRTGLFGSRGAS